MNELQHHGILGQKWGVRRFQNEDGTLTELGKRRLDRKDSKWAKKNYNKIYKKTYKKSEKELQKYLKDELNPQYRGKKLNRTYINAYNKKLAELMNKNVSEIQAPSGRVVKFIAKRGEVGVHLALADAQYDLNQLKNGVWGSGRVAYGKKELEKV